MSAAEPQQGGSLPQAPPPRSARPAPPTQQQRRPSPSRRSPPSKPIARPASLPPNAAPLPERMPLRRVPPRVGPFSTTIRRVAAMILSYPLERIRLGVQMNCFIEEPSDQLWDWSGGYLAVASSVLEAEGLLGLWAGLPVTLLERSLADGIGILTRPYMQWNVFSVSLISRSYAAWMFNHLCKYAVSHMLRHLILHPLAIARIQITSDVGIEKNQRRAKWRREQEKAKAKKPKSGGGEGKDEEEEEEKKEEEEEFDPEEAKEIDPWWPLPFGFIRIIQRVWQKDGLRGFLTGYPSLLAGALISRSLSLSLETLVRFLVVAYDWTGPIPLLITRIFGSAVIGLITYPISTSAHLCMAQAGHVPVSFDSELWININVIHSPDTWIQAGFGILASFANFAAGTLFDYIARRGQMRPRAVPQRLPQTSPQRRRPAQKR